MSSSGNTLMCAKCGFSAAYTRTGKILPAGGGRAECPDRIDKWYDLIAASVAEEVKREDFRLSEPVRITMENDKGNGYKYGVTGVLTLDRERLTFRASAEDDKRCADAPDFLEVPVRNLPSVATLPGVSLDLSDGKHTYRMVFTAHRASTKFALALEALNAPS